MLSQHMDTGPDGRTECYKLLIWLHDMIPDFLRGSKFRGGMYRHLQHNPQEEMKSLYSRIEDTFSQLCLGRENADTMITIFEDERVLKDLLTEMGYRKEWDDTKYEKMLKKGMKIADTVRNSCASKRNLP
jgi:hypothetical protein